MNKKYYQHNMISKILLIITFFLFVASIFCFISFLKDHRFIFIIIAIVIFLFGYMFVYDFEKDTSLWPNLIIGVGTFGTFLGIFLALQTFVLPQNSNFDDLINSLSGVIESIKFVFATSIIGIGTSILLRAIRGVSTKIVDNSTDSIYTYLEEIKNFNEACKKNLEEINQNYQIDYITLTDNINKLNTALSNILSFEKQVSIINEQMKLVKTTSDNIVKIENNLNDIKTTFDSKINSVNLEFSNTIHQFELFNGVLQDNILNINKFNDFKKDLKDSFDKYQIFINDILNKQTTEFIKALAVAEQNKISFSNISLENKQS